ncbi:Ser/Thr protein phosphatase family protein [Aquipseudomonas alcaligenes]|uniref:Phosphatase n=1 Tax=Aquipseudomonas alcaligenes (strain ATCC 14909 / DSM 50342 / CCUG 1425 / JCM 20561 / NBRC 14159 / NCIMB 9945 / NCTC 10367 / 1577) TaxID=1215092 RepID=U2ZKM8_AQUA1|nr:putative phosphatase [Pseudomonas alcaligenes NBRC 14159]SUD14823.1 Ser/Thr protein phosphatase family protein [Pseudomonas alcaligenes]
MLLDSGRGYDLIGDVHGCGRSLERLLEQMGYSRHGSVWRHPRRMVLFLGDIIDRGPRIREALHLVHDMVEAGQALCIMGNHEYNALGWYTEAPANSERRHVREHTPRHERLLQQTFRQFEEHPADWHDFLDWFQQLPLFIDAGRFRLVHACWDGELIGQLRQRFADGRIDRAFVSASAVPGSFANRVFERLLRGTDLRLPQGLTLTSEEGFTRAYFRTKFWEDDPQTYGDVVFQPDALPESVASLPLSPTDKGRLLQYGVDEPMLFVGHYWRRGRPTPIRPNLACLDYSAVMYGKLVAYRLDEETQIDPNKFVWVEVERPEAPQ